jgi:beta-galactosidase
LNELSESQKEITIIHALLDGLVQWTNTIIIEGDGSIGVNAIIEADSSLPVIPKIGMSLQIPDDYNRITWFGPGPQENYIDRCSGTYVGLFSMKINDFITPYIKPSENANRTGVRFMNFSGEDGTGIEVRGKDHLSMSAWPWTSEQLEVAQHTNELPVNDFITVNIDLKQMGVGGNDTWTMRAFPLEQFQIKPGKYAYSFSLTGLPVK